MDAETACLLLGQAGFPIDPGAISVTAREDRWAVSLPGDRMAWFPMNQAASGRLAAERRVLGLLAAHCSFRVPRVLHADEAGWQVRELVPGLFDPWGLFRRCSPIGHWRGGSGRRSAASSPSSMPASGGRTLRGGCRNGCPGPSRATRLLDQLPRVVTDAGLLRVLERVLRRYEDQQQDTTASERVLDHGDLGLHNLAFVPDTDEVAGVFDYDGAAWADRHQDFRYLVFPGATDESMLDGALEVYEPLLGLQLDRERIRLGNAACAIGFLAFRCGTPPEERSCGRTLAEDLHWVTHALQGLGER